MRPFLAAVAVFAFAWLMFVFSMLAPMEAAMFGVPPMGFTSHAIFKAAMVAMALFAMLASRRKLSTYGFVWGSRVNWALLVPVGLVAGGVGSLLMIALSASGMNPGGNREPLWQLIVGTWVWSSVAEEIFARGYAQSRLSAFRGVAFSLAGVRMSLPTLTGAVLFSSTHILVMTMPGVDATTVSIILASTLLVGLIAGVYREHSDSLLPAIAVHVLANVGGFLGGVLGSQLM